MIPYNLTIRDVEYYWRESILLWERDGYLIPVTVQARGNDEDTYPLRICRLSDGETLTNISIDTFTRRCLIHFPPVGYADMDGVPVYISARAGQGRNKGMDFGNIKMCSPIAMYDTCNEEILNLIMALRKRALKDPQAEYKKAEQQRRDMLLRIIKRIRRTGMLYFSRFERNYESRIIAQAVNRRYLSTKDALSYLKKPGVVGAAISPNYAIFNVEGRKWPALYSRMTFIGDVIDDTTVVLDSELSEPARDALVHLVPFHCK